MVKSIKLLSQKVINNHTSSLELVEILLANRHVTDQTEFLNPPVPTLNLKTKAAIKIIDNAVRKHENILIYGDYDVDGITATAILWQSLYQLTKSITPFVPHRERDGYGIKAKSFFRVQEEKGIKFDLLITVDNGIVAEKEFEKIKLNQDIKIIVTDHHVSSHKLESVDAIVASTELCGAAISYFLSKQLYPQADLGLAALGTVADCLPLTGINRSIVVHGLHELRLNPSPGIKKLVAISNIKLDTLSTYDLGFVLGPRINAVGRLADPTEALRLLCSQNAVQATRYAQSLNSYNQDRQVLQKESIDDAEANISKGDSSGRPLDKIIILSGEYNPGIIGLIAGRLTEKYYLPTIAIAIDGDVAKGSCRSIPELNIIDALREHQDLFIDLGGHAGAAGFSIKTSNISKLKKSLTKSVNSKLDKTNLNPHLDVDSQMELSAINIANIKSISKLSPFGIGNPEPLFLFKSVVIDSPRALGQTNDHLKFKVGNIDCIAFKKGELISTLKNGDTVDLVASLSINDWNNHQTPQLIIKEIIK